MHQPTALLRAGLRIGIVTTLALLFVVPLMAQQRRTTFNPSVYVSYRYTDNVLFVVDGDGDQSARIGVELPVTRTFKKGSMSFSYATSYTAYNDDGTKGETTALDADRALEIIGLIAIQAEWGIFELRDDE